MYAPRPGKCRMNITKVFFNPATDACEPFSYSGCGGNANNFMSVAQCEAKCLKKPANDVAENTQAVFEEKGSATFVGEKPNTAVPVKVSECSRPVDPVVSQNSLKG